MNKVTLTINTRPIPYKRTTARQKYVDKAYKEYTNFKSFARWIAIGKCKNDYFGSKHLKVEVEVFLHGGGVNSMGMDGDIDNYIKSALDSFNGVMFDDDRQVIQVSGIKRSCKNKNEECMVITIEELEGDLID